MHDRTSTPDILGSIMSGASNNRAVKQEDTTEIKKESNKEIKQTPPRKQLEEEVKEKATFNLPSELLLELEDRCHAIRKICKSKQISKTLLVEEALKMAFADFETKGQASKFLARLVSNKAVKQ